MKVLLTLAVLFLTGHCHAIENKDLYDIVAQGSVTLPRGDEKSLLVNLQSPIHFYTEKYDSIYVSFLINQPSVLSVYHPSAKRGFVKQKKNAIFLDNRKEGRE